MRIGALERTILSALADVLLQHHHPEMCGTPQTRKANLPEAVRIVKRLYAECPSYDDVIPILLKKPLFDMKEINFLKPTVPVKPMLAQPSNGVEDAFQCFGDRKFLCQYKYDGERLQIHFKRNEKTREPQIELFSRSCERCTLKYPDVADGLRSQIPYSTKFESVDSFIIDAEGARLF
jgi:DNA ligase 1